MARHGALRLILRGRIMIKSSYKKNLEAWHNLSNPKNNPTRIDGKRDTAKGMLAEFTRYTSYRSKYICPEKPIDADTNQWFLLYSKIKKENPNLKDVIFDKNNRNEFLYSKSSIVDDVHYKKYITDYLIHAKFYII